MLKSKLGAIALVFVPAFGFGAETDRFRTSDGAECQKSYDTGRSIEMGVQQNNTPFWQDESVFIRYRIELGRNKYANKRIGCLRTVRQEEERNDLENERLRLEVEMLRRQLEGNTRNNEMVNSQDDW